MVACAARITGLIPESLWQPASADVPGGDRFGAERHLSRLARGECRKYDRAEDKEKIAWYAARHGEVWHGV
jgi:hypothetical protein